MNADQKRIIQLAIELVQGDGEAYGEGLCDGWTERDKEIFSQANPLAQKAQDAIRAFVNHPTETAVDDITNMVLYSKHSPFSVRDGCWGIIQDAIYRRGYFASGLRRLFG